MKASAIWDEMVEFYGEFAMNSWRRGRGAVIKFITNFGGDMWWEKRTPIASLPYIVRIYADDDWIDGVLKAMPDLSFSGRWTATFATYDIVDCPEDALSWMAFRFADASDAVRFKLMMGEAVIS